MPVMDKLKNPDIAAAAAMVMALVLEIAVYLASDESLLGQLPPALGPVIVTIAAIARWKLSHSSPAAVTPEVEKPATPAEKPA